MLQAKTRLLPAIPAAAALLLLLSASASGQTTEDLKLLAPDGEAGDTFGQGLALSGDTAVIGAPRDDDGGADAGAAHVFDLLTGQQVGKLLAVDGEAGDLLGSGAAISGGIALLGAPLADGDSPLSGVAYVFDLGTSSQVAKLVASGGPCCGAFGSSVALNGDWALVGAPLESGVSADSGAAYLFDMATGLQTMKFVPPGGQAGNFDDRFGGAVALSGDLLLVGASAAGSFDEGAVFLFDASTGQQLGQLLATDGEVGDGFGSSLAVSGNIAVIGSPFDDDNGLNAGAAYVFDLATGQQLSKLLASDGAAGEDFGFSVAIEGEIVLVGTDRFLSPQTTYRFDLSTGQEVERFVASDSDSGDAFGNYVALSGSRALVSAYRDDDNGTEAGAAYLFELDSDSGGVGTSYCTSTMNSTGGEATIAGSGSASIAANDLVLTSVDVPNNQFGIFYYGAGQAQVSFGDGFRCVGGANLGRLPITTSVGGVLTTAVDNTDPPYPAVTLTAGSAWNFQAWFRDPAAGGTGFNLSDGLSVTFTP